VQCESFFIFLTAEDCHFVIIILANSETTNNKICFIQNVLTYSFDQPLA